jgi:hypothetical protein
MVEEAIFLHSSWRASSTYVWAKFRQRPVTWSPAFTAIIARKGLSF